jgi:hypothetical protein
MGVHQTGRSPVVYQRQLHSQDSGHLTPQEEPVSSLKATLLVTRGAYGASVPSDLARMTRMARTEHQSGSLRISRLGVRIPPSALSGGNVRPCRIVSSHVGVARASSIDPTDDLTFGASARAAKSRCASDGRGSSRYASRAGRTLRWAARCSAPPMSTGIAPTLGRASRARRALRHHTGEHLGMAAAHRWRRAGPLARFDHDWRPSTWVSTRPTARALRADGRRGTSSWSHSVRSRGCATT